MPVVNYNDDMIFLYPHSKREREETEKVHQRNTALDLMIFFISVPYFADTDTKTAAKR